MWYNEVSRIEKKDLFWIMSYEILKKNYKGIYYLHEYYPVGTIEHTGFSKEMMRFKLQEESAIAVFGKQLKTGITELVYKDGTPFNYITLTIMPSHVANVWGAPLEMLCHFLCRGLGMVDGTRLIVRHTRHDKLTDGGDRSIESHLETLKIDSKYRVKGKTIIVLDDVTTSGHSLKAAEMLLRENGAKKVYLLAIAQTMTGTDRGYDYAF